MPAVPVVTAAQARCGTEDRDSEQEADFLFPSAKVIRSQSLGYVENSFWRDVELTENII